MDVTDDDASPASPPASPPTAAGGRPTDLEDSGQVSEGYGVRKRANTDVWNSEEEEMRKRRRRDAELWSDNDSNCSSTYCQCTRSTMASPPLPRRCQTSSLEDNITLVASRALVRLASRSIASSLLIMPMLMNNAQCMCYSCCSPQPPTPHPAHQSHQQQHPLPPLPPYDKVNEPSSSSSYRRYHAQRPDHNNNNDPYDSRARYYYMGEDRPAGYD